jgi:multiple sugar transport system permease protein
VLTLGVAVPAGYGLAMTEFAGRRALLILTLVVMLMPNATLVVPIFLETNAVGLIGSMWSVILPFAFYPFGVYLTYIYFSTTVPRELLDAARLDGCSEFGVFRRVALPLALPVIALVGFFSFVTNWTNYFLPYVLLPQDDQLPVQVGLGTLLNNVPSFNPTATTAAVERPELALATLVAITPVLAVFLFSQRFLIAGMLAGSVKH